MALCGIDNTAKAQTKYKKHGNRHSYVHYVHHKVVVRKPHVHYPLLPRWRTSVTIVHTSLVIIKTKTNPYYFDRGAHHTPRNNAYVVVRPVAGVRIRVLPVGYRRVVLDQRNYYYYSGIFYKVDKSDEYETVDDPVGAVVDALSDGYEVKTIDGTEYYVLDDVYYAEVETDEVEDGIGYEVVKI